MEGPQRCGGALKSGTAVDGTDCEPRDKVKSVESLPAEEASARISRSTVT